MNSEALQQQQARRVLAMLDASRHSLAALRAAVELAHAHRAELVALYVEDENLLRSADFPFAREVGARTGLARPLTVTGMQATLSRQLQQVNRALESAAGGGSLRYSLQVRRGGVVAATLAQVGPADMLVLGKAGLSAYCGGVRLGSTCRALLQQAPCTVLVYDERAPLRPGPLRVLSQPVPSELLQLPLCTAVEALQARSARALEQQLQRASSGALLLHRAEFKVLADEDAQLLARIPVPVIVLPDPA
ncbi:universal stress protein [Haliea sp.]|jgi:nucleotide-binding universal stress UspA family protein|uniref:universal stress protein n=1 Tax=Haliea sp. TaxID=1932666 RepID=UPI0035272887